MSTSAASLLCRLAAASKRRTSDCRIAFRTVRFGCSTTAYSAARPASALRCSPAAAHAPTRHEQLAAQDFKGDQSKTADLR